MDQYRLCRRTWSTHIRAPSLLHIYAGVALGDLWASPRPTRRTLSRRTGPRQVIPSMIMNRNTPRTRSIKKWRQEPVFGKHIGTRA
ncbi:hypothetical protein BDZ89DRAFT_544027 [Hymenopellis radicata]|nr:hypothetical protein BDZ89DRAFT_544027 [Hymenopellis radicata]